jgi:hypothetical protein
MKLSWINLVLKSLHTGSNVGTHQIILLTGSERQLNVHCLSERTAPLQYSSSSEGVSE